MLAKISFLFEKYILIDTSYRYQGHISKLRCGTSTLHAHLAVFPHGQAGKVTEEAAQVLLKQTGISQVLSRQVHELVCVHHPAWAEEELKQ